MSNLLSKENDDEDYIINDKKIIFQITTTENQKNKVYENISTIYIEKKMPKYFKRKI